LKNDADETHVKVVAYLKNSNSRSARMFLYELCRKALSAPFDDPFIALDAAGVAKIDAILGTKPFLAFV
jgi:hypothetical protein